VCKKNDRLAESFVGLGSRQIFCDTPGLSKVKREEGISFPISLTVLGLNMDEF
jgi:hypothetical protein